MTTTSGLQERLHKRADNELARAIENAFKNLAQTLDLIVPNAKATYADIEMPARENPGKIGYGPAILTIHKAVFKRLQEKNREHAVKEFIGKVDTLHEQIDEIRDELAFDG